MGPAAYQQPSGDSLPLAGSGGRRPEATHPHEAVPSGPRAGCPPPHPHGRTGPAGAWAAHGKGHTTHLAGEPALGRAEPAARLRAPVKVAAVVLRGPELLAHGVHDPHVLLPGLRAHRGGVTAHLGDSRDVAERRCTNPKPQSGPQGSWVPAKPCTRGLRVCRPWPSNPGECLWAHEMQHRSQSGR